MTMHQFQAEMVAIPAGTIDMRDDRTGRRWAVEILLFLICRYPVTPELYNEVSGGTVQPASADLRPVDHIALRGRLRIDLPTELARTNNRTSSPDLQSRTGVGNFKFGSAGRSCSRRF
jgi:hypothetical protein